MGILICKEVVEYLKLGHGGTQTQHGECSYLGRANSGITQELVDTVKHHQLCLLQEGIQALVQRYSVQPCGHTQI